MSDVIKIKIMILGCIKYDIKFYRKKCCEIIQDIQDSIFFSVFHHLQVMYPPMANGKIIK